MYLNDYDPDDPPVSTHDMEADRLFGVMTHRLFTFVLVSLIAGFDFWNSGLVEIASDRPWVALLLAYFLLRALWPLLRSFEHFIADLRDGDGWL